MFLRSCYIFLVSRLLRRVHCFQRPTDGAYAIAGTERCSRLSKAQADLRCDRVRATEHAPRNNLDLRERLHALAETVERGGRVHVECYRVTPPQLERVFIIVAENLSRHGYRLAQECPGFFAKRFKATRDDV